MTEVGEKEKEKPAGLSAGFLTGRDGQTRTGSPSLPKRVRYRCATSRVFQIWGEWWGSNPRPPEPQPGALPTELHSPSLALPIHDA